jgi:hypothetical protein
VTPIDKPIKPIIKVQDSINNAKLYCRENPDSFVSLRDFSNGVYNQSCMEFAAEQRASDPTYKIGADLAAQDRPRNPGGNWAHGASLH